MSASFPSAWMEEGTASLAKLWCPLTKVPQFGLQAGRRSPVVSLFLGLGPQLRDPPIHVLRVNFRTILEPSSSQHLHRHCVVKKTGQGGEGLMSVWAGGPLAAERARSIPADWLLSLLILGCMSDRALNLCRGKALPCGIGLRVSCLKGPLF